MQSYVLSMEETVWKGKNDEGESKIKPATGLRVIYERETKTLTPNFHTLTNKPLTLAGTPIFKYC